MLYTTHTIYLQKVSTSFYNLEENFNTCVLMNEWVQSWLVEQVIFLINFHDRKEPFGSFIFGQILICAFLLIEQVNACWAIQLRWAMLTRSNITSISSFTLFVKSKQFHYVSRGFCSMIRLKYRIIHTRVCYSPVCLPFSMTSLNSHLSRLNNKTRRSGNG